VVDGGLIWDEGNIGHATRHGVSRAEIDAMYDEGRWIVAEDPLGRPEQERLVGEVPDSQRLVVVAVEWRETPRGWGRRPISSWEARPHETALWREDFEDG
jgi:uncharacterized DUF497 family protein